MLSLNSQVSFNLDSTLNKIESEDEIVNLWLSDFDDNGEEEIWINYINLDDNYLIEFWRLVSYAPDGEILSTYTKNCTPEKQFTKCKIFEYNNRKYLIEIYNENINDFRSCIIDIYDFNSQVLIDSEIIEIGDVWGSMGYYFNTRYIKMISNNDSCYIYLGLEEGNSWDENGESGSTMYKYLFLQDSLNLIESVPSCGHKLLDYEENEFLIAFHKEGYWSYPSSYSVSYSINKITETSPIVIEEIFSLEFNNPQVSTYLTYLTKNDTNYSDYGLIIYKSPNYNFFCFSPDLSEILWDNYNQGIGYVYIYASTCINTNQGNNFILYFYKDTAQQTFCEVRNRVTGNIALTQSTTILPFSINRRSDGELFFFTDNENQVNVYSLSEEIQVSLDDNEIIQRTFQLGSYPNPFNPRTTIDFSIPNYSEVELIVYNTKGQKIKTLTNEILSSGDHSILWNGDDYSGKSVSSGVYLYKLNVNGKTEAVKKCLLLK